MPGATHLSLDEEDSEYQEGDLEEEEEEADQVEGWDDDENLVMSRPKARRGQVSGEEDGEDAMEDEELQDAVDDMSKADSNQSIRRLKRRGNLNQS